MTPLSARTSVTIEWLRIALVAQVALGHYAMIALPPFSLLDLHKPGDLAIATFRVTTRFGAQAAYAFVFLSGYFLIPQLAAIARAKGAVGPFIAQRLRRIYPTLVAAIMLTLVCDLIGARLLGGEALYRGTMNYDAVAALNLSTFLGNLASLQPTFVSAFGSNGPLWTLGYLVQFYVVGSIVAATAARSRGAALAAAITLGLLAGAFRPEWLALALVWALGGPVRALAPLNRRTVVPIAVIGSVLFVGANRLPLLPSIAAAATGTACILTALRALGGQATLPRWAAAFSRASFAVYAFHFPLAMLAFAALRASGVFRFPDANLAFILLALLLALASATGWERAIARKTPTQ